MIGYPLPHVPDWHATMLLLIGGAVCVASLAFAVLARVNRDEDDE